MICKGFVVDYRSIFMPVHGQVLPPTKRYIQVNSQHTPTTRFRGVPITASDSTGLREATRYPRFGHGDLLVSGVPLQRLDHAIGGARTNAAIVALAG